MASLYPSPSVSRWTAEHPSSFTDSPCGVLAQVSLPLATPSLSSSRCDQSQPFKSRLLMSSVQSHASYASRIPSPSMSPSPIASIANLAMKRCITRVGWALSKNRYSSTFGTTVSPLLQIGSGSNEMPPVQAASCVLVKPSACLFCKMSLKMFHASML